MIDFSFIIPVYNAELYIKECIDSVINQRYDLSKIEIILINDGSTDNSYDICREYSTKFNNIVLINQKNKGVSITRNNGLKIAKGKYILFLDSDDFVEGNLCSKIYKFFEKHYNEIDILTYPLINYENNKQKPHFRYKKYFPKSDSIYDIEENPELIQTTINVCIKNKFKDSILFDSKLAFSEDEKFITDIIMLKKKVGYCSSTKYFYRKNNESCTKTYSITPDLFAAYTTYYRDMFDKYPDVTYVKNLFLNTLRWRISESKLLSENIKNDISVIKELLENIDIVDIFNLPYLSTYIRLAILQLKGIKYELTTSKTNGLIIKVNNEEFNIVNKFIITFQNISLENKSIILKGNLNFPFTGKNLQYETEHYNIEILENKLYEDSGIHNLYSYDIICDIKCVNQKVDFGFLNHNLIFKIKKKTYRLKYLIESGDNFIILKRMNLGQILKKIISKCNFRRN